MTNRERAVLFLQIFALAQLVALAPAYAYVDPGSGSVIVTTILGVLAAIGYTVRKYFYRLKRLVTGQKAENQDDLPA
jgi:hypothetical protein